MDKLFKPKDLYGFQKNITRIVYLSIIISFVLSMVFLLSVFLINRQFNLQTYKSSVDNANKVLQSNLSAQFAIIANDPNFISYLKSGSVTRDKYVIPLKWTFSNFNKHLIKGIQITDKNNQIIFLDGKPTDYFATLDLCYLGNKINTSLGECTHFMTVFIGVDEYLKQLHNIEPHIISTETKYNGYKFQPFSSSFGLFHSRRYSIDKPVNLAIYYKPQRFFIGSLIGSIAIFILCLIFSQRYLNSIIKKELIYPVKYITDSLGDTNTNLTNKETFLSELNTLIDVVNEYHNKQIYSKLERLTEDLAHKLNNPLSGIIAIMPKIMATHTSKPELNLLERHINTIYSLTSNILHDFRQSTEQYIIRDDMSQPRYIILEDIMAQIYNDFKEQHTECLYSTAFHDISWIYAKPIDLQDSIVNLLNNAYESLICAKREITLTIIQQIKHVEIDLLDSGCGIPKHEFDNVQKSGKSLKHPGQGIGLTSAARFFEEINGSLVIEKSIENIGTKIKGIIPLTIPDWYSKQITYDDKISFIVVSDNISIIVTLQKLLIKADNNKFYFTDFKDYVNQKNESFSSNQLLITTHKQYQKLFSLTLNNDFNNVYIICETHPEIEIQNLLQNHKHHKIILKNCISPTFLSYQIIPPALA
jgi:signal transduction histidine kinase